MVELLIVAVTIYFILKVYISVMQIGYISEQKNLKAVLMPKDKYKKSALYAITSQRLSILDSIIEYIMFIFWIKFGLVWLDTLIADDIVGILKAVYFVLSFLLFNYIITLPLSIYKTFVVDKKYGFSNITPTLFLLDELKGLALTIIIGGGVVAGVAYIISSSTLWWLYSFVFILVIIVAINALYPTIMSIMYNKFEPLKDKILNDKIISLLQSVNFKSSGVFQVDASKRDSRLNAYFGGLGKTKRVVLFDTLIEKLSHDELIAVLGHELGHFKNRDILKNIVMMAGILFVIFAIVGNIPQSFFNSLSLFKESSTIITIFLLISSFISFFMMPLLSFVSRQNEYAADRFGADVGGASNLVSALLKLVEENLSFPKSHTLFILFYYSHPPLIKRLQALGYDIDTEGVVED